MGEPKYNIIISEGCTAFGTEINGKMVYGEGDTFAQDEIDEFVDYLCNKFKDELKNHTVQLDDLIRCFQYDETKHDNHICDTCGETVTETIWNI